MSHTFLYCKKLFLAFYCLIATVAAVVSWAYWPSVRSRWPDIGQVLFCVFIDRLEVEVNENAKKYEANIQPSGAWSITDLLYSQKAGPRREIPSGQDGPIFKAPARAANKNVRFASSYPLADSATIYLLLLYIYYYWLLLRRDLSFFFSFHTQYKQPKEMLMLSWDTLTCTFFTFPADFLKRIITRSWASYLNGV